MNANTILRLVFAGSLFIVEESKAASFVGTGELITARFEHTATMLPNGQVLIVGGVDTNGNITNSVELYNPGSGAWTEAAKMTTNREHLRDSIAYAGHKLELAASVMMYCAHGLLGHFRLTVQQPGEQDDLLMGNAALATDFSSVRSDIRCVLF